ncbi:MAG: DUF1343 domain-containing protein [Planctomycetales bacterium]|nr:DUF1343 domain-containing protein [Planctomycetales bacterium]
MMAVEFQTGLEQCLRQPPPVLQGKRLGVLMNQASVDARLGYACDCLAAQGVGPLTALFSPQHGMWGEQQANMIESAHERYAPLGLPVYSLYSETRRPTAEMLSQIDCLLIDLQDVGTRVYTFVWTMLECLRACAEAGLPVVLLDRPNPIGGEAFEGPLLSPGFESFVGNAAIPLRHGLTPGELARLLVAEMGIAVELHIVPLQGWQRRDYFSDLPRQWVWPSPNMPTLHSAVVYPGQVLLEGTNLSEGRGTTQPFELFGAPFLDPYLLLRELQRWEHPGLCLRPLRFCPTFDKWAGQRCGGLGLHIVDERAVRSVRTTVMILAAAAKLAPEHFAWLPPPYEYEYHKPPIDILFGSAALRKFIDSVRQGAELDAAAMESLLRWDAAAWQTRIEPYLLYD